MKVSYCICSMREAARMAALGDIEIDIAATLLAGAGCGVAP